MESVALVLIYDCNDKLPSFFGIKGFIAAGGGGVYFFYGQVRREFTGLGGSIARIFIVLSLLTEARKLPSGERLSDSCNWRLKRFCRANIAKSNYSDIVREL